MTSKLFYTWLVSALIEWVCTFILFIAFVYISGDGRLPGEEAKIPPIFLFYVGFGVLLPIFTYFATKFLHSKGFIKQAYISAFLPILIGLIGVFSIF
jgi:hypothetical protein